MPVYKDYFLSRLDKYYCWNEANCERSDDGCFYIVWVGAGLVEVKGGCDDWGC